MAVKYYYSRSSMGVIFSTGVLRRGKNAVMQKVDTRYIYTYTVQLGKYQYRLNLSVSLIVGVAYVFLFNHSAFTLTRVWQCPVPLPLQAAGWMEWLVFSCGKRVTSVERDRASKNNLFDYPYFCSQ
jgi:hypothetical protein